MRTSILRLLAAATVVALGAGRSNADFSIDTADRGQYKSDGTRNSGSYLTGLFGDGFPEYRSYFAFDIPSSINPFTSATFKATNPNTTNGFSSTDDTETFKLFAVATSASDISDGVGVPGFIDLGTGIEFGSATISASLNDLATKTMTVNFNADGLTALNAARGGPRFVFGGALTTLAAGREQFVFIATAGQMNSDFDPAFGSTTLDGSTDPVSVATPLPPTLLAGFLGMAMLAGVRRLRRA